MVLQPGKYVVFRLIIHYSQKDYSASPALTCGARPSLRYTKATVRTKTWAINRLSMGTVHGS
ncbi:hypothetical protein DPMN_045821 [Dreissena polymorpha]|uniref:Uncharacterized protein n=1 Tax=Dreissena polymorpha TaxID=45954 RepID=A0A9D4D707_DREPO|nr:hypothetical protein DPMN_045821 [Dreissena polymorpha]